MKDPSLETKNDEFDFVMGSYYDSIKAQRKPGHPETLWFLKKCLKIPGEFLFFGFHEEF